MPRTRSAGPARRDPITRNTERFPLAMMAATLAAVALFIVLALLAARADAATRTLTGTYEPGSTRSLELDIPFGDVRIEGTTGRSVRVRVEASCGDGVECDAFLQGLRLESRAEGRALRVDLDTRDRDDDLDLDWNGHDSDRHHSRHRGRGPRNLDLTVTVEMPRSMALDLDLGAGELAIDGMRDDVSIDMGAGEISVRMPESAVRSVNVDLAVGETVIRQGGRTREYTNVLGGEVSWESGKGEAGIDVDLGAGEVEVTLE
jgi:hypothetical protein